MLSTSSKYALKAVLFLALDYPGEKKILAKDISRRLEVPQAYISKLLQELTRHNIISSSRGRNGGFYLTDSNIQTPLIEIINIIDGENRLQACLLNMDRCNESTPCPIHHLVGNMRSEFIHNMENTTIKELAAHIHSGKSFLVALEDL